MTSMRRKRLGLFIVVSLCSWIAISYFLFVYCPHCQKNADPKEESENLNEVDVNKLELQVDLLANEYQNLFAKLKRNVIKKKASVLLSKLQKIGSRRHEDDAKAPDGGKMTNDEAVQEVHIVEKPWGGLPPVGETNLKAVDTVSNLTNPSVNISSSSIPKAKLESGVPVIAVLVISCNRVTVAKCLDELLKWRPSKEQFPIIVSQDCSHQATTDVLLSYGDKITLIQQPDQGEIQIPPKEKKFKGYFKIARHYGWALNQTFFNFKFDTAIIVEDDLTVAPDFYEYFLGTYWLLKNDPTLWCVSAWNDNGKSGLIDESQPELLHRTDFFPGLGWMLTSSLWAELSVKWPKAYWDDWIRKPEQRKNRACIRPELPRTKTFGKIGVSNGMFFEKHLKYIKLNNQFVSFTNLNLTYLMKDVYDSTFVKEVYASPVVSYQELKNGPIVSTGSVRIPYYTKDQYKKTAKYVGLMDDFRSGVPRTAYRGVVTFSYKGRRVYLAPHYNWKTYDITWS